MASSCRVGVLVLLWLGCSTAASPPPPPAARGSSGKPKVVGVDDAEDDAFARLRRLPSSRSGTTRPALLRRQGGMLDLLGGASDGSAPVVETVAEDEDAEDAPEAVEADEEPKQPLWQQFIPLVVVLIVRVGLTFMRAYYAKRAAAGEGGAVGSPLDAINAALLASPIGAPLKAVGSAWAKIQEFARSPSAAPYMMGLLILGTRLVKMMEARKEAAVGAEGAVVEEEPDAVEGAEAEDDEETAPEVETVEEAADDDDEVVEEDGEEEE